MVKVKVSLFLERSDMVANVGLNTNFSLNNNPSLGNNITNINNTNKPNSVFDLSTPLHSYENDFMLSGCNLTNFSGATLPQVNAQNPQSQAQAQQSVAEPQAAPQNVEVAQTAPLQPAEKSLQLPPTEVKSSNTAKVAGGILGFLAPLAGCAVDLFKGVTVSKAFNLKQLAVTCPLVALAGFGVGMFIDGCINTKQAQKAVKAQAA